MDEQHVLSEVEAILRGRMQTPIREDVLRRIFGSTEVPVQPPIPESLPEALQAIAERDRKAHRTLCERVADINDFMAGLAEAIGQAYYDTPNSETLSVYENICLFIRLLVDHHETYHILLAGIVAHLRDIADEDEE